MNNLIELSRDQLPTYEGSTPKITEFDPRFIPWQYQVVKDMEKYDYSKGTHEILVSGAVGSAKSILGAHQAVKHCIMFPKAELVIGRRAMPDLKDTLFKKIGEHIGDDLKLGVDYRVIDNRGQYIFRNGSKIISKSWADKRQYKVRSLELSAAIIEEAAENSDDDRKAIEELRFRVGRRPHVPQKWIMYLTNPDSPSHWLYKHMILEKSYLKHVYYSKTLDNPFLDPSYYESLLIGMDNKMARRMLGGEWLDILGETVYHQYDPQIHEVEFEYKINPAYPIHFSWDFNIGQGKPMSVCFYQIIDNMFHVFDEVVIEGARTESCLEEAAQRGLFDHDTTYLVHGDAAGKHKDTRNNRSDYEIIENFLNRYVSKRLTRILFRMDVPLSNPSVRERHNTVNAYLRNALGQVRVLFYPRTKTLREGMRLVKLRKGADYVEDDSKYYQHVTTALGYGICWYHLEHTRRKSGVRQL